MSTITITINSEDPMGLSYFASVLAEIIVEQTKQVMVNDDLQDCSGSNCGHDWAVTIWEEDDFADSEPDDGPSTLPNEELPEHLRVPGARSQVQERSSTQESQVLSDDDLLGDPETEE